MLWAVSAHTYTVVYPNSSLAAETATRNYECQDVRFWTRKYLPELVVTLRLIVSGQYYSAECHDLTEGLDFSLTVFLQSDPCKIETRDRTRLCGPHESES